MVASIFAVVRDVSHIALWRMFGSLKYVPLERRLVMRRKALLLYANTNSKVVALRFGCLNPWTYFALALVVYFAA